MAMHSNKDMNHKPCFFLMKKIQSKKNIGRLEETAVFVGLSEIIDHIKPQTVSESCRQCILCSNIYF